MDRRVFVHLDYGGFRGAVGQLWLRTRRRRESASFLYEPDWLAPFREISSGRTPEHWMGRFDYAEAGPQLLLQAYCHRVVNSGGRIEREYATGRGRVDLLLCWPRDGGAWDRFVVECKVLHGGRETTEREGLEQTAAYMDRSGAKAGHLVVFDRSRERSWGEKIYRREAERDGLPITIWGM